MDRRGFITKSLAFGASCAGAALTPAMTQAGLFENLLTGVDQTSGTLLDRIDVVLRNANKAFRGLYHGYGLGIRSILDETRGPLPTTPPRSHAGWPHVHCVCHCNAVANLGPEDGVLLSQMGGLADELSQAYFARMFYEVVYPMTWADMTTRYSDPSDAGMAQREMRYVINYSFGDAVRSRRALMLASVSDKKSRQRLEDYRDLIYGLIDALESAWQRSDFHDNVLGRDGGLQCPQRLTAQKKREWCSDWCTKNGVPTNVAEGRNTARPWGPYHPLYPGPVPTMHDFLYGNSRDPFDPKLNVPPPDYAPIPIPEFPGMYTLPVATRQTPVQTP